LLTQLDIPFCTIVLGHPADDMQFVNVSSPADCPKFSCSILCMNLIEFEKFLDLYEDFSSTFGHVILQAPWELPKLPDIANKTLQKVDEFWAISEFVKTAYLEAGFNNVVSVPLPCRSPSEGTAPLLKRTQNRPFTLLYIFDASSFWARKNPMAAVRSFQFAFRNNEDVRLVLKVTNSHRNPEFKEFSRLCQSDPRIVLKTETQSDSELTRLFDSIDCYLSLHRSEGFGRTIAEACLNQKPVIATNWSGSCDILPINSELLVKFSLVELKQGDYPFSDKQVWAEPDEQDAAIKMLAVYNMTSAQRKEVGKENLLYVVNRFTQSVILPYYKKLLTEVKLKTLAEN
jgi:hypothetical protein